MKRVLIWGTGKWGSFFSDKIDMTKATIVGYLESEKNKKTHLGLPLYDLSEIEQIQYDIVLIAFEKPYGIREVCVDRCIDLNRVCFAFEEPTYPNAEHNCSLASEFLNINGTDIICRKQNFKLDGFDKIENDRDLYNSLNQRESLYSKMEDMRKFRDDFEQAGTLGHYFYQDYWAAEKIIRKNPKKHFDIGSRVDGFIMTLAACHIDTTLIDIREMDGELPKCIHFLHADATNLSDIQDNTIESLSALCSLEHFGLGRYGDKIDPEACFTCFESIQAKMRKGGVIYISVPVGKEKVEFNAHRIYYIQTIIDSFNKCDLIELSVTDGNSINNIQDTDYLIYNDYPFCYFGLFEFVKK